MICCEIYIFWSVFFQIRIEYGYLQSKSPYSVQIGELRTIKNPYIEIVHTGNNIDPTISAFSDFGETPYILVFSRKIQAIKPFITGKIEKLDFWDPNNSTNFKHQYLKNHECKVNQPGYQSKAYWILFMKRYFDDNVYSYRFRDIAVRR